MHSMKMKAIEKIALLLLMVLAGCAPAVVQSGREQARKSGAGYEDPRETVSALKSVTEAVSGRELTDKELQELDQQLKKTPEAQSAVRALTESLQGTAPKLKYCPVDGKRFSPRLKMCPEHKVPLKDVE